MEVNGGQVLMTCFTQAISQALMSLAECKYNSQLVAPTVLLCFIFKITQAWGWGHLRFQFVNQILLMRVCRYLPVLSANGKTITA